MAKTIRNKKKDFDPEQTNVALYTTADGQTLHVAINVPKSVTAAELLAAHPDPDVSRVTLEPAENAAFYVHILNDILQYREQKDPDTGEVSKVPIKDGTRTQQIEVHKSIVDYSDGSTILEVE